MRLFVRMFGVNALAAVLLLGCALPATAGAPKNPYDKYRNATYSNDGLMTEQEEMQLGAQVHQQVLQKYRIVQDPDIANYIQDLGERIAQSSRRPDIPYQFFVLDDSTVNAFALPGGYIYVHTGLLNIARSESELTAAIAHEIGHVVARHGLRNVKKAQRTALIFGILGAGASVATGGGAVGDAAEIASQVLANGIITKNSRDFEREADYLGLYTMRDAGYDPLGMALMFQRLNESGSGAKSSAGGGIFASHPNANERIKNTLGEIDGHLGGTPAVAAKGSRPRRASGAPKSAQPAQTVAANSAGFDQMKAALGGLANRPVRNPNRQNRRNNPGQNDPYSQPAPNDRPVLTRKP
ncbi:MAG: M48 family metalloprotease [Acidobacteria bacterium]|nr:M48 family metalloprotease [Acidobacteriota bacterium]